MSKQSDLFKPEATQIPIDGSLKQVPARKPLKWSYAKSYREKRPQPSVAPANKKKLPPDFNNYDDIKRPNEFKDCDFS